MIKQVIECLNSFEHLQNINQDYLSHCKTALKTAYMLQVFAIQLAIHSLVPNLFVNTSLHIKDYVKSI